MHIGMKTVNRVIVTGSTGNLGAKAVTSLARLDGWKVDRIGRNSAQDKGVINADLTRFDASWARYFEGADAVVHLAADPKAIGSWESITRLNVDLCNPLVFQDHLKVES